MVCKLMVLLKNSLVRPPFDAALPPIGGTTRSRTSLVWINANARRPWQIYADYAQQLIEVARETLIYSHVDKHFGRK